MDYEVDFDNEAIVNIETKVITKKQTPETDEALMLLERAKKRVKKVFIIPFVTFLVIAIGFAFAPRYANFVSIIFGVISLISLIVYFIYRARILSPYYSLLNVAIKNDEIRHEERIRFRERKRLENEFENQLVVTEKEKAKIEKTKVENIETMNKLKEENKLAPVKESTFQVAKPTRINLSDVAVAPGRPAVPRKKPE
mgnify:FL=1